TIARRLTPAVVAMGSVRDAGTRSARYEPYDPDSPEFRAGLTEVLADRDARVFAAYVERGRAASRVDLARHSRAARVHPVFFGSAVTGAGTGELLGGLVDLLP